MNSRKSIKKRSIGALLACCLIVAPGMVVTTTVLPGCDWGAGFLGLQDYQRDLLFGAGALACDLLGGCGPTPTPAPNPVVDVGCTIEDNEDGTSTITCISIDEAGNRTSTAVTVSDGEDGMDGVDGTSCTVTDNPDNTITITCPDGSSATFEEGSNGTDGEDGEDGRDGRDGRDGTDGEDGESLFGNLFIDAFFTPIGGSFARASAEGALNPQSVFEPSLGDCGQDFNIETVAYKMGVPERYDMDGAGNPITMRLYIYRTGVVDGCAVLQLDAVRAAHGETAMTYGDTRFISLDLSEINEIEEEIGALLVIDLPLNNGPLLMQSLGFPTPDGGDLLAFELNTVEGQFNDGGCYTMLGVDFFESAADDPTVDVANAEVFASLDDITGCRECVYSNHFEGPDRNDVGGGITEFEADADDVAVVSGMLRLRDDGDPFDDPDVEQKEAQAVLFGLDVSAFADLSLSFKWTSLGGDFVGDKFYVQWRACDDPANISTNGEDPDFLDYFETPALVERSLMNGPFLPGSELVNVALPQAAIDAGCIDLRFVTIVSDAEEGVLIDFIDLCGEPRELVPGYVCINNDCVEVEDGTEYATLDACISDCFEPEPDPGYVCVDDTCVEVEDDAEYSTLDDCNSNCFPPAVMYECEFEAKGLQGGGLCFPSPTGTFSSLVECEQFCEFGPVDALP